MKRWATRLLPLAFGVVFAAIVFGLAAATNSC